MTLWLLFFQLCFGASDADVLASELARAHAHLNTLEEVPHYIALGIWDEQWFELSAVDGAVGTGAFERARTLDIDMRVGTPDLDSTHQLRGFSGFEGSQRTRIPLPMDEGHEHVLKHIVWRELDKTYRDHAERIVMLRTNQVVKVAEEDSAPDFEVREPIQAQQETPELSIDATGWEERFRLLSARLDDDPEVYRSTMRLKAVRQTKTFVDTEGTKLTHGNRFTRLSLMVQTRAEDGDPIDVFRAFDTHDPARLPDAAELMAWVNEAVSHLKALRAAPRGEPYTGPVLLQGKATGVFFHEVFGHRVEGHRQKSDYEGKTFADYVGEEILPPFIDVIDDPTQQSHNGVDLNGYYHFDDEGVPAAAASLVESGRFQGFLMGRSPIEGFLNSNGHGRRMTGYAPVSRMGNTIVTAKRTKTATQLRAHLLRLVKEQGLPYGYIVADIDGGFTMTGRVTPNAFNVRANTTWRVYPDGRPDELVRGIDLVGTPLVAFKSVVAAGRDSEVFNGHCGAESGYVPVSAVAPSVLVRRLEFQRKEKGADRPPLLPKPMPNDGQTESMEVRP